jgi:hypothetical protein
MTSTAPATRAPLVTRTRVIVVVGVLLVVAALVTILWKDIKWGVWINGADKPEFQRYLLDEEDPDLIPKLVAAMRDEGKGTRVRVSLANVLIKKNRIQEVEALLRDPSLGRRIVAFLAFSDKPFFRKQYVEDPTWGIEKTVDEWLADTKRTDRGTALKQLDKVYAPPKAPEGLLVRLRSMLAADGDAELRWRAALRLASYQDCSSVPALVAAAKTEEDAEASLQIMNAVLQIHDNEGSPCRKELAEADVRAIVEKAFDHPGDRQHDLALRQRAIIHYRRWPAWIGDRVDALRKRLLSPGSSVERRVALEALVAVRDPEILRTLPRFFHDEADDVRSSAVQALPSDPAADLTPYEGALVGYVRDEPGPPKGRAAAFEQAVHKIRISAGEWVGFPEKHRKEGQGLDGPRRQRIADLWKTGKVEDVTRAQVAEAMWRWLAKRNGVTDEAAIDEIQKTRAAFWEKARAKDVPGAKAILEKPLAERPNLWSYEQGWVLKNS